MSIEANKRLVLTACKYLGDCDLPALFDLIHEDGSWSIPFRSDRFQFGGFRDKPAFIETLTGFLGGFERFSFEVINITAEEERVIIEAKSSGLGPGDAEYENNYLMIFFVRDGKLHTVREYFDPFNVLAYIEQWPAQ